MKRKLLLISTLVSIVLFHAAAEAEDIVLTAADGVRVYGDVTRAVGAKPPVILAFHMAGSNHAEYSSITPRLVAAGFTVLAIDQRSGGTQFGVRNKTVEALGRSDSYVAALPDLEAALAWGKIEAKGAPVLVWGSSYSAALVFLLAASRQADISGVLAFSPGEYLAGGDPVHASARKVQVPVFVTQANESGEISDARSILAAVKNVEKTQFVPQGHGVHGSSSLNPAVNGRSAEDYWIAVLAFLKRFKE